MLNNCRNAPLQSQIKCGMANIERKSEGGGRDVTNATENSSLLSHTNL